MSLTINGRSVPVQGVRELKTGMTIQEASEKTKNNGLDEVFFTSGGKSYIAYGDSLKIGALHRNKIPSAAFNGQAADIVAFDDEINSVVEGMGKGAANSLKETSEAVIGAVKNIITTVGPGAAIGGGAAIAGYSIYRILQNSGAGGGGALAAAGAGTGVGNGIANSILDAIKSGAVGALKIIAVAGAIGAGVTVTYGAVKGAMEARSVKADYTSIASVSRDGTTAAGGSEPPAQAAGFQYEPPAAPAPVPFGSVGQLVSPQALFTRQ